MLKILFVNVTFFPLHDQVGRNIQGAQHGKGNLPASDMRHQQDDSLPLIHQLQQRLFIIKG
jgi:hypothetical protein